MRKAAGREPSKAQTPEGEKKFGQKIGEIIRRDGMKPRDDPATKPDVAAKAKSAKVKPVTTRKGSAHVADVATKAVAVKKAEPAKATKPKVLASVGGGGSHEGGESADHVPERDVREGVPASGSGGPPEPPDTATTTTAGEAGGGDEIARFFAADAARRRAARKALRKVNAQVYRDLDRPPQLDFDDLADFVNGTKDLRELADRLSGRYGPYVASFKAVRRESDQMVSLYADVIDRHGRDVGQAAIDLERFGDEIAPYNRDIELLSRFRRKGFGTRFTHSLENMYRQNGVYRVRGMPAREDGGSTWARDGYTRDPEKTDQSVAMVIGHLAQEADERPSDEAAVVDDMVARLVAALRTGDPNSDPDLPTPSDLVAMSTPDNPSLGKDAMKGSRWHGVKYL